jgi:hypothetical protein
MSSSRQEELSALLERVLTLPAVAELRPDARTRRVHYDWLEAGEHTQRTVAQLSQQLRRFLDDQAWLENRRIMDILHGIEAKALALRETPPPANDVMSIADTAALIELPMERPLYTPPIKPSIADLAIEAGDEDVDAAVLFSQVVVDRAQLARHIRQSLQGRAQVTLRELCATRPLEHGLAELVAYLQLAGDSFKSVIDEDVSELIVWRGAGADGQEYSKQARLARVIFVNGASRGAGRALPWPWAGGLRPPSRLAFLTRHFLCQRRVEHRLDVSGRQAVLLRQFGRRPAALLDALDPAIEAGRERVAGPFAVARGAFAIGDFVLVAVAARGDHQAVANERCSNCRSAPWSACRYLLRTFFPGW